MVLFIKEFYIDSFFILLQKGEILENIVFYHNIIQLKHIRVYNSLDLFS